jgi:uncharacterized membrane protein YeiH
LIAVTLVIICPAIWFATLRKWLTFFDAIGLSAFSIQGALYATKMNQPLVAVIFAAVMTGIGGGVVRDMLAGRKPLVLQKEIYALWSVLIGVAIGLKWADTVAELYVLFAVVVILRMVSVQYDWRLPGRLMENRQFGRTG